MAVLLISCSSVPYFCAPATAQAAPGSESPLVPDSSHTPQSVTHGNFTVLFSRFWNAGADSGHDVNLFYEGNLITDCGGSVRWSEVETFSHDGCSTLDVTLFTGGASCCYGTYLLTSCGGRDQAVVLNNEWFSLEDAPERLGGKARFSLLDTAFIGYAKEGPDGSEVLRFSQAGSPAMQRLVLFDEGAWRTDRSGEFPQFYQDLIQETAKLAPERDDERAAQAMILAYFALMSGEDSGPVFTLFSNRLPAAYSELAEAVFADIRAAALNNAKPLVQIDLQSLQAAKMLPHTVLPGETLHSIGREYGVSPSEIYQSNPQLQDPNLLKVGEELRIPAPAAVSPQAGQPDGTASGHGDALTGDPRFFEQEAPGLAYPPDDAFTGDDEQRPALPPPGWLTPRPAPRLPARDSHIMAAMP